METNEELIKEARELIAHCKTYNFGLRGADRLAHEIAPRLVDALEAATAAAGVTPQPEGLLERIADTLAYYQCRETNPKADHPRMGYHAFSDEQRAHLRSQKAEAAAEIVRIIAAAGGTPQEPGERERLAEVERAAAEKAWDEGAEAAFYNPEIRGFVDYPDNPYWKTKEEHGD